MDPGRLWDASGRPLDGSSCPGSVRPLAGLDALGPRHVFIVIVTYILYIAHSLPLFRAAYNCRLDAGPVRVPRDWPVVLQPSCGSDPLERTQIYCADENMQRYDP